jgi:uncharacterized membrane protein YhaH (DUF805 family)
MNWLIRPWRHAFDYRGRSPRREYWLFVGQFLFGIVLVAALSALIEDATETALDLTTVPLLLFVLASMPVGLAAAVRRLHDHDKSGLMVLLYFIPFVGGIIFLVLMLITGTDGPNSYGEDPRLGEEEARRNVAEIFS